MLRPYSIVLVIVAMMAAGCSWFQPANPASTEGNCQYAWPLPWRFNPLRAETLH